MQNTTRRDLSLAAAMLICGLASAGAYAAEDVEPSELNLRVGAILSDNITYANSSADEQSGGVAEVGVTLVRRDFTSRLKSQFDVDLAYQHYLGGEFSDQLAGGAAADVSLGILPGRFDWVFLENYSQVRKDALAANTPNNLDYISYFTTGPRITLPFGDLTELTLGGEYSIDSYSEDSALGGTRIGGRVGLTRNLSNASSISLNGVADRRRYDNETVFNQNYDIRSLSLSYALAGARTQLGADLGYEQISVDSVASSSGGLLARLTLKRQTSPASSVGLDMYREYSDAGRSLRSTQNLSGVSQQTGEILESGDAFIRQGARATWNRAWSRTSLELMGEYSKESHDRAPIFDRDIVQSSLRTTRRLRPNLSLSAEVQGSIEKFRILDLQVRELAGIVSADWHHSNALLVRWTYELHRRSGKSPVAEYSENRTSLYFVWNALRGK